MLLKNKRAIFLLFIANTITGFAQGISVIAIPWYYTNELERQSEWGQVYLLITLGMLFWILYAGTLIDKYNRKMIFLVNSAVECLLLLGIALTGYYFGEIPVPLVALAFAGIFFSFVVHYPNLYAFCQEITEAKHYQRVTSWVEIQGQFTNAMAGAFAAILLYGAKDGMVNIFGLKINIGLEFDKWQLHEILLLDAFSFILAIIVISLIIYQPIAERKPDRDAVLTRLKGGIQYLRSRPKLFLFGVASFSVFLTVLLIPFYLGHLYVQNHLQAQVDTFGIAEMYFAIGSILAGVFVGRIFSKAGNAKGVLTLMLISFVILLIMVFTKSNYLFYGVFFIYGFSNAGIRVMRITYAFRRIPNNFIGRVNSVLNVMNTVGRILFLLLFSFVTFFHVGNHVIYAILVLAGVVFIAALAILFNYRKIEKVEVVNY